MRRAVRAMAKSAFEYVREFEAGDRLLPNAWLVVRLDGQRFHRFAETHGFAKPNDERALRLASRAALAVMEDCREATIAYGQSDEYSFVLRKHTTWHNRRAAKILTSVVSQFTAAYVFYWRRYFADLELQYPPAFDGRVVVYPSDKNIADYLRWRQADVHVNNLYNTTFWTLVLKGNLTPKEAEKRLCGTVSSEKNELLFGQFNINYNDEPLIFKRGTILLRKLVHDAGANKLRNVVVDVHEDMLREKFWKENPELLLLEEPERYDGPLTELIKEQLQLRITKPKKVKEI